ncbi:SRPBCC family protein [Actinacidiphila rubida]|uniref:SRPBCC family protein n=1 Tax=Actinacidiphila rubida TaxID=310780 RepID=UPI0015A5014C|nr:SRPBCC family protein [Actinacidiphila rubida]
MSTNVFVSRPAAEVFDFLADARNLALWSSGVASVEATFVTPGPHAVYHYRFPGRRRPHVLVCADFEPCRRIAFRGERMWSPFGTQVPLYAFDLLPHADGTLVRLSVTSSLSAALVLMAPLVAMAWRRDLPADGRKFCDVLGGVLTPAAPLHGPLAAPPAAAAQGAAGEAAGAPGGPAVPAGTAMRTSAAPHGFDYAH